MVGGTVAGDGSTDRLYRAVRELVHQAMRVGEVRGLVCASRMDRTDLAAFRDQVGPGGGFAPQVELLRLAEVDLLAEIVDLVGEPPAHDV